MEALRLESSDAQPLRSTCEAKDPAKKNLGNPPLRSFALYSSEMDKRLFSVSFAGVPRPSSSTAVVVVFQSSSAILLRGTTHDLLTPEWKLCRSACEKGGRACPPAYRSEAFAYCLWNCEDLPPRTTPAVVDEFSNLRVPVAVPSSLLSGTTEVFVSTELSRKTHGFSLVSALPGEIQVLLPPGFLGEDALVSARVPSFHTTSYEHELLLEYYRRGRAVLKIQGGSVGAVRAASGEPLDAACVMTTPFRLVEQQVRNLSAQALQVLWTRDTHPIMVLGFVLSAQAAPARLAVLAPLGLWTLGACRVLQDVPAGYSSFTARVIEIETGTLDAGTRRAYSAHFSLPRMGSKPPQVARANWQHGAEACQRGLSEASTAWRGAAPYVDKAILLVNVTMAITIGGFIILGIMLVCMPLMPERAHHGAFDRMFWVTQGLYLIAFSVPALVATVQCGILRNGFENWPSWMRAELWLGILKFQLGRAVFFVGAGFYVFPLMDNFGLMAKVELWAVCLSYLLGIVSLLSGSFLLIFDVVLSVQLGSALDSVLSFSKLFSAATEPAPRLGSFEVSNQGSGASRSSFFVAHLESLHAKRLQAAVKAFRRAQAKLADSERFHTTAAYPLRHLWHPPRLRKGIDCEEQMEIHEHWIELFNDLIMVAMLSNLSHLFEVGGWSVVNHAFTIVLWFLTLQSLHFVSYVVNMWTMDDFVSLLACFCITLGSVLMASSVRSDVHPPCVALWYDDPHYVQRFNYGVLCSKTGQLAILLQAAFFEPRSRTHVAVLSSGSLCELILLLLVPGSTKYLVMGMVSAGTYVFCWKYTDILEMMDLHHFRSRMDLMVLVSLGEWVITTIIRDMDVSLLVAQTGLDLMLAAEYFNTRHHGHDAASTERTSVRTPLVLLELESLELILQYGIAICLFLLPATCGVGIDFDRGYDDHGAAHSSCRTDAGWSRPVLRMHSGVMLCTARLLLLTLRHIRKCKIAELPRPGKKFYTRFFLCFVHVLIPLAAIYGWGLTPNDHMGPLFALHAFVVFIDVAAELSLHQLAARRVRRLRGTVARLTT
ncbi:unnamed protein product [Effrenium voratum]|nr:unnamed protein product [Effrenium voratum]